MFALVSFLALDDTRQKIYTDKDSPVYSTIDLVTRKAFFDISVNNEPKGRIVFGLFGRTAPITAKNFAELCSGEHGFSKFSGAKLSYTGTRFFTINDFYAVGGDFIYNDGTGSESIYQGGKFKDESLELKHT